MKIETSSLLLPTSLIDVCYSRLKQHYENTYLKAGNIYNSELMRRDIEEALRMIDLALN